MSYKKGVFVPILTESTGRAKHVRTIHLQKIVQALTPQSGYLSSEIIQVLQSEDEMCVNDIVKKTGQSYPTNVSINLNQMLTMGLVNRRQDYKHYYYSVNEKEVNRIIKLLKQI